MKKTLIYLTAALLASFALSSCTLDEESQISARLRNFTETMVANYVVEPVVKLCEQESSGKNILKDGYSCKGDNFVITLKSAADKVWTVESRDKKGTTIVLGEVQLTGDNSLGLHEWTSSASVVYDEGNGYSAGLTTVNPAKFYWKEKKSSTQVKMILVFDGKFTVSSYLDEKQLDGGDITFSACDVDDVRDSDWKITNFR